MKFRNRLALKAQKKLMKGDTDEAVAQGAHVLFFPCGTGHMLGLDVHDMEDFGEVWVGYNGEQKNQSVDNFSGKLF